MLTRMCNLSCNYCFEKNISKDISLKKTNISNIISFVENYITEKPDVIDITYTGGEPFMSIEPLTELTKEIKKIAKAQNVSPYFSIITNGTILKKTTLNFLNDNNFSMQITLDGTKENHDAIRYLKEGTGTFDIILENIELIIQKYKNIILTIRVNISQPNFGYYENLLRFLYIKFPQIRIYIDFLDVEKNSEFFITDSQKIDFYTKYLLFLRERDKLDFFNYFESGECMIRKNQNVTIDCDGGIYKCYSLVGNKQFETCNIVDLISYPPEKINALVEECNNKSCIMFSLCRGGCPYKSFVLESELKNSCKYDFLIEMNSLIFIAEIVKEKNNHNLKELVKSVEYFKLNI